MSGLRGNKGEWSEVFTFLNVLGKGRIYGADGNVEQIDDMILNVDKVIKDEDDVRIEYLIDGELGEVTILENGRLVNIVSQDEFIEHSDLVFDAILESKGAFSIPSVDDFMERISCRKLKASSNDKTDIRMELYDSRAGYSFEQGFSIKSMLGSPSTLLNASMSTNFIFKLSGDMTQDIIDEVNRREGRTILAKKFKPLVENNIDFEFRGIESETFYDNLELIDSNLPVIVAEMLKLHYLKRITHVDKQVETLTEENPLDYRNMDIPHYEYKIKKLLVACALGMVPDTPWEGREDANGGILIVKKDREVGCYHIYNRNEFEDYLLSDTKLETPSTSRHGFSFIERTSEGDYILKLNLQIRFK